MIAINGYSKTQWKPAMVQNGNAVDEDEEDRLVIDVPNEDMPAVRQVNGSARSATYTCRVCKEEYKSYRDCLLHETSHGITRSCNSCNKQFTDMYKLEMHVRAHARIYPCKFCGETYKRKQLKRHLKEQHKCTEIVRCTICNFTTPNLLTYRIHILSHKECENQTVVCIHCKYQTKDYDLYQKHLVMEHKVQLPKSRISSDQFLLTKKLKQDKKLCNDKLLEFQCKVCSRKFNSVISLEKHEDRMHNAVKKGSTLFKCFHCNKMVGGVKQLRRHELKHRKMESENKCEYCNQKFIRVKTLMTHIEMAHKDGENFICLICNFVTPTSSIYKEHCQKHLEEYNGQERS